ncbi:hypothetical protein DPMN_109150 [Dreissena polymorpha]|uniref:Uncharacterized protein n=1 Tax=Dreissena polymorpha TaxID=45954 RepID=A0A9D4QLP0_DREPO|nr:hypothetical protein DPMN_109150 [Dreissena polymorpha]
MISSQGSGDRDPAYKRTNSGKRASTSDTELADYFQFNPKRHRLGCRCTET